MVKLRVIGSSADNTELILSNRPKGRRGSHSVTIDRRLLSVLQKAVYARREAEREETEPEVNPRFTPTSVEAPKVPPREIQRLLRAGMSIQQVARATDLDIVYIEQFVTPVLYEREGIVRDAQSLYSEKARLGQSGLPLGDAVDQNLAQRRVRLTEEQLSSAWSATRNEGEPWSVTLTFPFRGRSRRATWRYDPRGRTVVAANKLAHDMGWVAPGATRLSVVRPAPTGKTAPRRRTAAKRTATPKRRAAVSKRRAPAKRKAAPKRRATPKRKAAPKRKATPKRRPAARRKPTAKRRAPARRPARKPAKRKPASRKPASRKPARRTTAKRKPAKRRPARRR